MQSRYFIYTYGKIEQWDNTFVPHVIGPSINAETDLYDSHWCQYKELLSLKGIGLAT